MSVVIVILSHRSKKKLFYDKRRHDYHQKTRTLDFETGSNGLETSCSRQAKRPRDRVKDSPYLEHCVRSLSSTGPAGTLCDIYDECDIFYEPGFIRNWDNICICGPLSNLFIDSLPNINE